VAERRRTFAEQPIEHSSFSAVKRAFGGPGYGLFRAYCDFSPSLTIEKEHEEQTNHLEGCSSIDDTPCAFYVDFWYVYYFRGFLRKKSLPT
jgi:hypothetical protein